VLIVLIRSVSDAIAPYFGPQSFGIYTVLYTAVKDILCLGDSAVLLADEEVPVLTSVCYAYGSTSSLRTYHKIITVGWPTWKDGTFNAMPFNYISIKG
jgi:hypothetical protein